MIRQLVVFAIAGFVAAWSAPSALADREQTEHVLEPFVAEIENPCNGEIILLEGEIRRVVTSHLNPSGQLMLAESTHISAAGVGSFGNQYRYVQTSPDHAVFELTPDGALIMNVTGVTSARIAGQGDVPDFAVHLLNHITINANGEVTSAFVVESAECQKARGPPVV